MSAAAKMTHVNVIARDWRRLAAFYETVFGCVRVPPERDLAGPWLDAATGIPGAHIRGVHLRFPGNADGPTLEIFQYDQPATGPAAAVNRPGYGHLALAVEDVAAAREAVRSAGGSGVGDHVRVEIPGAGWIRFAYVADPEGNVIELQRWEGAA